MTQKPELKWTPCQVPELTQFLVDEMGFSPDRVAASIVKLQAAHKANHKPQTRMDAFFQVKKAPADPTKTTTAANKRKADAAAATKNAAAKKPKGKAAAKKR